MFDYKEAFSRNIGWVTEQEQQILKNSKVAIAGLGGVGADEAIVCCRMGIGSFNIADFDTYDYVNFNRQAGANINTVGQAKAEVMQANLSAINPGVEIINFKSGVTEQNIDQFLDGVDVYIDSLDIFALEIRRKVFQRCYEKGIPAITAAPMGMGTAVLIFVPGGMTFEEYFCFSQIPDDAEEKVKAKIFAENIIKFVIGVSPSMQQRKYLVQTGSVNFLNKKVPSICMGIYLAAGALCTNVLKLILKRGDVIVAPRGLHFDAYRNTLVKTWRPFGNKNPMQRYMLWRIKKMFSV